MEMGEGVEGVKTKMHSKGQEIILKRKEGFSGFRGQHVEEHDQREPGN